VLLDAINPLKFSPLTLPYANPPEVDKSRTAPPKPGRMWDATRAHRSPTPKPPCGPPLLDPSSKAPPPPGGLSPTTHTVLPPNKNHRRIPTTRVTALAAVGHGRQRGNTQSSTPSYKVHLNPLSVHPPARPSAGWSPCCLHPAFFLSSARRAVCRYRTLLVGVVNGRR